MNREETLKKIRAHICENFEGRRLLHIFAVEEEVTLIATKLNLGENELFELRVAALLHDITKTKSYDWHIQYCMENGITLSEEDRLCPKILHAITGAVFAKNLYPCMVSDSVFNAIRYHTTGRTEMSLCEKILYIADYIEKTRTFSDCVELRKFYYNTEAFTLEHIDKTLLLSFELTFKALRQEGQKIHTLSMQAALFLEKTQK